MWIGTQNGLNILEDSEIEILYKPEINNKELALILPDIEGWIIRSGTTITEKHINDAHKLAVIGRAGVGVDNIDVGEATNLGVMVGNTPGVVARPTADIAFGLLLNCARRISESYNWVKNKQWEIDIFPIVNNFYGEMVTVAGLLTGKDILNQLKNRDLGNEIWFSNRILNDDQTVTLDDFTLDDLSEKLKTRVNVCKDSILEIFLRSVNH